MSRTAANRLKSRRRVRFDVKALRRLAGEGSFARGEAYYREGLVQILSIDPARILAEVAGSEDYRTEVSGRGNTIDGECSCPAFHDRGFCKHMVAVGLAANAAGEEAEADGVSLLGRIREHLKAKGIDALVEMIMTLAERDAALFRRLELISTAALGDRKELKSQLKKAIDNATRTSSYVGYREAAGWAEGVGLALDAVDGLLQAGHAGAALELAEHAADRIERAAGAIDDSDGHCGALLERAWEVHLAAARAARPDPMALARSLFAREMGDGYGMNPNAAISYAEVLGEQGLAEYRRLATDAWNKLPPRVGKSRRREEFSADYDRLMGILDVFAERDGDIEMRIALRAKDLSSPWDYLQLAEFCLSQGRAGEAGRRAEEGVWMFEDDGSDEPLVLFLSKQLVKSGRKPEAEAHLWRTFEKAPSIPIYMRLRKLGRVAARDRALRMLEGRLAADKRTTSHHDADLLVSVLLHEKMFDAAWTAVRRYGASSYTRDELARASEGTHPRDALTRYRDRVDQLVGGSMYDEAAKLVSRIAGLHSATDHVAYVADLKLRYGRRRNFMKLLP